MVQGLPLSEAPEPEVVWGALGGQHTSAVNITFRARALGRDGRPEVSPPYRLLPGWPANCLSGVWPFSFVCSELGRGWRGP